MLLKYEKFKYDLWTVDTNDPGELYSTCISTTSLVWIYSILKYESVPHQETMNIL